MNLSTASVNTTADAWAAALDGGSVEIYTGTMPTTADTAIGAQVLLVSFTLGTPAFGAASGGIVTLNLPGQVAAAAAGTATWARWKDSGGGARMDTSVGISSADLTINNNLVDVGNLVEILSFSYQQPK